MNGVEEPVAVARAAMRAVETGQRDDWLARFAADAHVEDPVGHLPPLVGRDALAAFWDNAISALDSTRFEVTCEWQAGNEALLIATVHLVAPGGAAVTYDGAFHYTLDAEGAITKLRAFWDLPAVVAALGGTDAPDGRR